MQTRRFGRTGLLLPVFACGGMRFQQSWTAATPVQPDRQRHLERTVDRALELGLFHFETARGYGTSEAQLGRALSRLPRDRFVLQTKVPPKADPAEFKRALDESFVRLRTDRLDLFAFHGLNNDQFVDFTLRDGGCWEVAEAYRRQGRIGAIGFSTHGNTRVIQRAIESDRFDYVNLHFYYIFQDNWPAIAAATRHDMGVFIISPTDKGGHLHTPRGPMLQDCAPLSPMQWNDLFCLSHPEIHVLSLGAARPEDFDAHLAILPELDRAAALIAPGLERLERRQDAVLGKDWRAGCQVGVPEWEDLPGGANVRATVWLWNITQALDLLPYARSRYNMLGTDDHWFPGNKPADSDPAALRRALAQSPLADRLMQVVSAAHAQLNGR